MNTKMTICLFAAALLSNASFAEAQQAKKVPRIGYLGQGAPSPNSPNLEAFREGMRQLGYVEGQNIIIEYRHAESRTERFPELAADLVRLKVDIIVATGTRANLAAKKATSTIPIVMAVSSDPLGSGLVESLARPGGNVTGFSSMGADLSGKRLELFREAFPKVRCLAVLWNTTNNSLLKETLTTAQTL